nr:hypothetical protein [Tanacetum cinerariifolium]
MSLLQKEAAAASSVKSVSDGRRGKRIKRGVSQPTWACLQSLLMDKQLQLDLEMQIDTACTNWATLEMHQPGQLSLHAPVYHNIDIEGALYLELGLSKDKALVTSQVSYFLHLIARFKKHCEEHLHFLNIDVRQDNRKDGDIGGNGEAAPNMLRTLITTSRIHGSIPLLIHQFLHKNTLVANDKVEVADLISQDIGSFKRRIGHALEPRSGYQYN